MTTPAGIELNSAPQLRWNCVFLRYDSGLSGNGFVVHYHNGDPVGGKRVPHEDALHAIGNAYYVETEFDEPRPPSTVRPTLYIGPPQQLGGALLEVMVEIVPPRELVIFHVMPARQKHLERMNGEL